MSIIATYVRLDANGLDKCRENPHWLEALCRKEIPGVELIDIDKACDGLVWVLERMPAPAPQAVEGAGFVLQSSLASLLQGGTVEERRLKAPYGPASRLSPQDVAALSAWLQAIDADLMRSRYNAAAMDAEEVYPEIWSEEGLAAFDDYLMPYFQNLQAFFLRAAEAQQHVLVCFT